ncbi:hypothetical protein [Ancylobacter sp.]|uniref:hypothetical protein n=1 Tax=Ancylobacter sp. TaxID=1872567 RepID=UPI003D10B738
MTYLIFDIAADAQDRSAQAWLDCGYEAGGTDRLWLCLDHPTDGRGALMIPATPSDAQIGLSQEAYEALLTGAERDALVPALTADWTPEIA